MNDDTEVYRSCSATLNGEVFVFGGDSSSNNRKKQVSVDQSLILTLLLNSGLKNYWLRTETCWRSEL